MRIERRRQKIALAHGTFEGPPRLCVSARIPAAEEKG